MNPVAAGVVPPGGAAWQAKAASSMLAIEEADDQLGCKRLHREGAFRPRLTEVGQVPPLGDEAVETPGMSQYGLNGVVGQIVPGEEAPLLSVLALPGDRAVSPLAAQRRGPVGFLLEADQQVTRNHVAGSSVARVELYAIWPSPPVQALVSGATGSRVHRSKVRVLGRPMSACSRAVAICAGVSVLG